MQHILFTIILLFPFSPEVENNLKSTESKLPNKFETVDMNDDEVIQTNEVEKAIERFVTGDTRINSAMIDELIDYYFEQ